MTDLRSLEYPRHVHLPSHPDDWRSRVVAGARECAAALADGYSLTPVIIGQEQAETPIDAPEPVAEPVDVTAEPESEPEPEPLQDDGPAPAKRKPGRPPKVR